MIHSNRKLMLAPINVVFVLAVSRRSSGCGGGGLSGLPFFHLERGGGAGQVDAQWRLRVHERTSLAPLAWSECVMTGSRRFIQIERVEALGKTSQV
jgi:hypothetical protein